MYLYKLTAILLGAICGNNTTSIAQQQPDYFGYERKEAYWKLVAGSTAENPIIIRFEQPEELLEDNCTRKQRLENLEGRLECRMRISLNKSKINSLRIYWSGNLRQISRNLTLLQRIALRRAFRKMDIEIIGEPPLHLKYYKTTWICALDKGKLKKI